MPENASNDSLSSLTDHFNQVYDETFEQLRRYTALRCSDPAQIADLLQEIYLDYFQLLQNKGTAYIKDDRALLLRIADRKLYRYYSFKVKLRHLVPLYRSYEEFGGGEVCTADEEEAEKDASMEEGVLTAMEAQRIWRILSGYPTEVQKIFYLYFYEGFSHSQIAKAIGCSLSNVKNKLYRTLEEIREKEKVQ